MPTDTAKVERDAALVGARSVAEAMARVADAAVAAISKAPSLVASELQFTGSPGGRFRITGSGFGSSGTVKVGGTQVQTLSWSTTEIEGKLPAEVRAGEVVVQLDDKTSRRGQFKL